VTRHELGKLLLDLPDRSLEIGETLRLLAGFGQEDFVGIHQSHLSRIESGKYLPCRATRLKILGALPKG
jgi:hypothetical protein